MSSFAKTLEAKSDQLNADDLIGTERLILITDVRVNIGDQPVSIGYQGDDGKPWKPGKSMRRALAAIWGIDPKTFIGRAVTVYRDPEVVFGGDKVGGIRIKNASHIEAPKLVALTVKRGKKAPYIIDPMPNWQAICAPNVADDEAMAEAAKGAEALKAWWEVNKLRPEVKALAKSERWAAIKAAAESTVARDETAGEQ
jgi:hypothetical protein